MAEKLESKMQGEWQLIDEYRPTTITVISNEWNSYFYGPGGWSESDCLIDYLNRKEILLYDCFGRSGVWGDTSNVKPFSIDNSKRYVSFPSRSELCVKTETETKCTERNTYTRK